MSTIIQRRQQVNNEMVSYTFFTRRNGIRHMTSPMPTCLADRAATTTTNSTQVTKITTLLLLDPFNGLSSRTTWVSWHQKGKPFWILLEQEMMGWQWHQLDHTQIICTSLQSDNYISTSPLSFYMPDALPAT